MTGEASNPHLAMTADGAVATITFARPQKGNAYDKAMLHALDAGIRRAGNDLAIRVLVLRGEGKHFCAGADLSPAEHESSNDAEPGVADVCLRLSALPKPTVALVQGACLGGGMAFAACCDILIAAQNTFFSMPEARIGFSPTPLIPFMLQAVGERHARRLLMTGARFDADEALHIGLATEVCAQEQMEQALADTVSALLQSAPGAVASVKTAVARLKHQAPTPELLAELQRGFDAAKDSAEAREGRAAMRAKRPPNWAVKS
ncbi:MAG: enoyl-CoA hydratase/isomerase family protein [Rhizobiales bacterium]|nr:enoyl-CoA hydratase/isomerase family protein [Hyphomicrobiales bacterium]